MVKHFYLFSLLFFLIASSTLSQNIAITEALDEDIISCKITGKFNPKEKLLILDENGKFQGKCLVARIQNKTRDTLFILIPAGLNINPKNEEEMQMITSSSIELEILPKKRIKLELYALSLGKEKDSPNYKSKYSFGEKSNASTVKITNLIDKKRLQNSIGQGVLDVYTNSFNEQKLQEDGLSSRDIECVINTLNEADIYTLINPEPINDTIAIDTVKLEIDPKIDEANHKKASSITISKVLFYVLIGFIVLLFLLLILSLYKGRRKKDPTLYKIG